jgi:hypothetical protein
MPSVTVELDDDQIFEIVQELDKGERIQLAREIMLNDDDDLEDDILSEVVDEKAIEFIKDRLEHWLKPPMNQEHVRAVLEHAIDAAKKIGLLVDGQPILSTVGQETDVG